MSTAKSVSKPVGSAAAEGRGAAWRRYVDSLRYSLYLITHPFDGFWDLSREKRGSLAAAHTFLALFLITYVLKLLYTNFQFISAPVQYINIYEQCGSLLLPFLILCLSNWALSTLFDGKGRFKDIYMAMCYALVPYILIQLPLVLISNITGIAGDDILGKSRLRKVVEARHLLMWALHSLCGYTSTMVGVLTRRDHATVTYANGIVSHERYFPREDLKRYKELIRKHHQYRKEAEK